MLEMKNRHDFPEEADRLSELISLHILSDTVYRRLVEIGGSGLESTRMAQMLKFSLYREICDENGGLPPISRSERTD